MRPIPPSAPEPGSIASIEIGDCVIPGGVVSAAYQPGRRSLVASVLASDLVIASPDFAKNARVWVSDGTDAQRRFGLAGSVVRVVPQGEGTWHIEIAELGQFLETTVGGIGTRNCAPSEIFWALVRDIGLPADRVNMGGWVPPTEKFIVAIPVEGVEPSADLDAGAIGITRDPKVPERFGRLGPDDLRAAFAEPGLWAVQVVTASRMWDVEQAAVQACERLLGRLAVAAQYTMAVGPGGDLRPYDIVHQRAAPRLRRIAGLQGSTSGRQWLRGYGASLRPTPLDPRVIVGFADFLGTPNTRLDEAIAAWRRAAAEPDSATAAVALSEALEFYAAEARVAPLFTKSEIRSMTKAAQQHLAGSDNVARRQRIELKLGQLNEPPAAMLLRTAIDADQVPCSESDFALLRRVREVRRRVLHGDTREALTPDQLREALSLVNRFLAFRLQRLSKVARSKP